MNLIFLGAPGVGKGTQADLLSEKLGIPHISTGDIFRENMKNKTPLGLKAQSYVDGGGLVPDELVLEIVNDRLKKNDAVNGYILDGVPRTIHQAEVLDTVQNIDKVINFDLSKDLIVERLSGRRTCAVCKTTFHIKFKPSRVEGVCDDCGGALVQREDEKPEKIVVRLETYNTETKPLIEFYEKQGKLIHIDAEPSIEEIQKVVLKELGI